MTLIYKICQDTLHLSVPIGFAKALKQQQSDREKKS